MKRQLPQTSPAQSRRSAMADVVGSVGQKMLERATQVAMKVPHNSPERFKRVENCLDPRRAAKMVADALDGAPPDEIPDVLWIEPNAIPVMGPAPPIHVAPMSPAEREERDRMILGMLWRDYCKARAEVHAHHAALLLPNVQRAEAVAASIPQYACDRAQHPGSAHPDARAALAMQAAARFHEVYQMAKKGEQDALDAQFAMPS